MKEVKKCSISGIAFTLDADAYALLSRYLDSLKATYAETADGDEIVADIEARIAELILSQQENSRVVETPLLRQIISQMGTAEDISSESETDAAKKQPRIPRRLYRDTENARLGGVCAGLGRYFDVDATWVRLTLFAPLLLLILVEVLPFSGTLSTFFSNLFGVFVLGYFIMWFAVPAARSARQKLEMEGEPITVRSIREKTVRDSETNSDVKSIVARVIYALGQLALIVIKIFIGFFIFGLTFAACILLIVLFALIFGDPGGSGTLSIAGWTMTTTAMGVMGLLTVLIPLLLLIYILFCLIASRKPSGRATLIVFLLWILTIVATGGLILRVHPGPDRSARPRRCTDAGRKNRPAFHHPSRRLGSDAPAGDHQRRKGRRCDHADRRHAGDPASLPCGRHLPVRQEHHRPGAAGAVQRRFAGRQPHAAFHRGGRGGRRGGAPGQPPGL